MRIAFIGFGEAGRAIQATLKQAGVAEFAAYDILVDSEGMDGAVAGAAREAGVVPARSGAEAVKGADWIISAVTAASSLDAAQAAAPYLARGQAYLDINSVSPQKKKDSAAAVRLQVF